MSDSHEGQGHDPAYKATCLSRRGALVRAACDGVRLARAGLAIGKDAGVEAAQAVLHRWPPCDCSTGSHPITALPCYSRL